MRKRVLLSVGGVLIGGVSVGLFRTAELGVDPFQSLMSGLEAVIPISFGTLYVIVNALLLLVSLLLDRRKIGLATLINLTLLTASYFSASHFASLMLDRLRQELLRLGYRLNTYHVSAEEVRARRLPFAFQPEQVSAVVCIEMFDWDYDNLLCGLGLPILFVDGPPRVGGRSLPADQLYMDNSTELTRLLSEMLRKGVRRIGFWGDYLHCQSFFERYMSFRMVMALEGVPVEERFILPANGIPELSRGLEALEELPELFVCANDFVAYDALQILRKLGKRVPEDLMLCGFDDAPESRMVVPALTTVHIHTQAMAFSAAQLLLTRIREPSLDYRKLYTETELLLRESTMRPGE